MALAGVLCVCIAIIFIVIILNEVLNTHAIANRYGGGIGAAQASIRRA
jgi:hypothetical protein